MDYCILGVDLGTTNLKVVAYSEDGRKVAEASSEYPTYHPQPDWAEQDPRDWISAFREALSVVLRIVEKNGLKVHALCTTSQREGVVPVGADGRVLDRCIIWMDQRCVEESRELEKLMGARTLYEITGLRASPTFTVFKLMWLKRHKPRIYEEAAVFLQPKEFLNFYLTGVAVTDPSMASRTMLFNIVKMEWADDIAETAGISLSKMPEVMKSDEVIGQVKPEVASKVGLDASVLVVNGGGDRPCEALGSGAVVEGVAAESTGTATNVMLSSAKPVLDPYARFLCSGHVVEGLWLLEGGTSPTGAILRWFRDNFALREVEEARKMGVSPYDVISKEAEEIPPGSDGLIVLPFFMGSKVPKWNPFLRGLIAGLTLGHTKAHIARAIMEGIAYLCREIIEAYESAGVSVDEVRLLGGAAKSLLWSKIKASVWQKRVLVMKEKTAAALGAVILAGKGVGLFESYHEAISTLVEVEKVVEPVPDWVPVYDEYYKKYLKLCELAERFYD